MNTRTKRLEPRLRLLISGRFFPQTCSIQSLGWPAHLAAVPDQAAPHAEATWIRALEATAVHADAIVCLFVDDSGHSDSVLKPDWPSRLLDTVSDWRHQWHPEPVIIRCLSLSSLAHAGAVAGHLLAPIADSDTRPTAPLDSQIQRALQACGESGHWHVSSALPLWHYQKRSDNPASVRRGLGLIKLIDHLLRPLSASSDWQLCVCGPSGERWISNLQPAADQRLALKRWLQRQRTAGSATQGTSCVTNDPHPAH